MVGGDEMSYGSPRKGVKVERSEPRLPDRGAEPQKVGWAQEPIIRRERFKVFRFGD